MCEIEEKLLSMCMPALIKMLGVTFVCDYRLCVLPLPANQSFILSPDVT